MKQDRKTSFAIADLHCDTLWECAQKGYGLRENSGHLDLLRMKETGGLVQCFAICVPREADGKYLSPREIYHTFGDLYDLYQRELQANADLILPALSKKDIMDNQSKGTLSAVLTVEDGTLLDGKIDRLEALVGKGVRMLTLTWNEENAIGYPNSSDPQEHERGLKPFGFSLVEAINRLPIIADVSHLSAGGFFHVAQHSNKPFVASHSCAYALQDHPRNLTDEQLRVLGEKGGAVGVNFYPPFLSETKVDDSIALILRHMKHIANKGGIEILALGSDFDGYLSPVGFDSYRCYRSLLQEMERHFSLREMELICHDNFLRIMEFCIDALLVAS